MNIKKITNTVLQFSINRMIEILGIFVAIIGILLLIALVSYSPNDPNFIFPQNTQISNVLGFQGSYISDLFLQSIGIISYLLSITLVITGINVFRGKDLFLIIENIFYSILYCIFGSLFFDYFYQDTFELYINGNGGFVGQYLSKSFFGNIINLQPSLLYYFLIILILGLFLVSINFNLHVSWIFLKKIINYVKKDRSKTYTDKSEIINEYIDLGVNRLILGTAAIKDQNLIQWQINTCGADSIVIGVDARNGFVEIDGWTKNSGVLASELISQMIDLGVKNFLYTDILKDGMLTEPNYKFIENLLNQFDIKLQIAGGISNINHLKKLDDLGVMSAIVGKAIYTGEIDLSHATKIYSNGD